MSARHELRRLLSNPALLIGLIGTLALFAMGVFGGLIAPYDPSANQSSIITVLSDGREVLAFPPTLPDREHWFGTDPIGRDQWSRVLAGAWITLSVVVAAALGRLGIGFSLGLTTGWYSGPLTRALGIVATGIAAVPQLLLAIMLVLVTRPFGVAGFIASLALVGWPEIGEFVRAEVVRAKSQPFIEAARSVGVPGRRLVTGHLFATVGPQLLTVAALETGASSFSSPSSGSSASFSRARLSWSTTSGRWAPSGAVPPSGDRCWAGSSSMRSRQSSRP